MVGKFVLSKDFFGWFQSIYPINKKILLDLFIIFPNEKKMLRITRSIKILNDVHLNVTSCNYKSKIYERQNKKA